MRHFNSSRSSSSTFAGSLPLAQLVLITGLALSLTGCAAFSSSNSFSESSGSVSDSVGSSSDSSGSSSGEDAQAYRDEIRAYVVAALKREQAPEDLRRGVSELALGHGISDWEAVDGTWIAIHAGFADASVDLSDESRREYERAFARPSDGTLGTPTPISSIP